MPLLEICHAEKSINNKIIINWLHNIKRKLAGYVWVETSRFFSPVLPHYPFSLTGVLTVIPTSAYALIQLQYPI